VATALVTLARLGIQTAFLGRVGDDLSGEEIRAGLEREGVDCRGLLVDPGKTSQMAFIAVEKETARRTIFWTRGGARPLVVEELDGELIRRARVLHLDGLQDDASVGAARIARDAGVVTVLDGGTVREGTLELLPFIDHLVASEKFARQLGGAEDARTLCNTLLKYGAQAVTVTFGENGSWTIDRKGEEHWQEAFPVKAIDTTGCGDVFHGGYIFGLLRGWLLPRTVRFAAACAALKTRALGGRTAIPSLDEVETFLSSFNCKVPER